MSEIIPEKRQNKAFWQCANMPKCSGILSAIVACGLLVAGCSTSSQEPMPTTPEYRQALSKQYSDAAKAISQKKKITVPPYPQKNQVPTESAACKNLKDAKKRQMIISEANLRFIALTDVRPWAIYKFDVNSSGVPSNLRLVKSAGLQASNHDFAESIKQWRFVPTGATIRDCVAEMRIL